MCVARDVFLGRLAEGECAVGTESDVDEDVLDLFSFFVGGASSEPELLLSFEVVAFVGGERFDDERELFGIWMPNEASETLLRRVL